MRCFHFYYSYLYDLQGAVYHFPLCLLLLTCKFSDGSNHDSSECIISFAYMNIYACVYMYLYLYFSLLHHPVMFPPTLCPTRWHLAGVVKQSMLLTLYILAQLWAESALLPILPTLIISTLQMERKLRLLFFICSSLIDNRLVLIT